MQICMLYCCRPNHILQVIVHVCNNRYWVETLAVWNFKKSDIGTLLKCGSQYSSIYTHCKRCMVGLHAWHTNTDLIKFKTIRSHLVQWLGFLAFTQMARVRFPEWELFSFFASCIFLLQIRIHVSLQQKITFCIM